MSLRKMAYQKFPTYEEAKEFATLARQLRGGNYRYFPDPGGWTVEWVSVHPNTGFEVEPGSLRELRDDEFPGACSDACSYAEFEAKLEARLLREWYEEHYEHLTDSEFWLERDCAPSDAFESYNEYWNQLWEWSEK